MSFSSLASFLSLRLFRNVRRKREGRDGFESEEDRGVACFVKKKKKARRRKALELSMAEKMKKITMKKEKKKALFLHSIGREKGEKKEKTQFSLLLIRLGFSLETTRRKKVRSPLALTSREGLFLSFEARAFLPASHAPPRDAVKDKEED